MSTLLELTDLMQGTDEWLEQRRGIVTASVVKDLVTTRRLSAIDFDCPACDAASNAPCRSKKAATPIKTLHPERASVARNTVSNVMFETASNDTSRALTATLVAERITGWTVDMFVSDDMMRGVEDEPRARDKYSEHFATVTETGFMVREFAGGVKIGYSPDGLVGEHGLIEAKSRLPKKHLETILSGEPPRENMAQLQCGLLVSGRAWIDYISYCGGMPMWVKRVYPDRRWFDAILIAVAAFEADAAEMIRAYNTAIDGFPTTNRELTEIRF